MTSQSQFEAAVDGTNAEGEVFVSHSLEAGISDEKNILININTDKFNQYLNKDFINMFVKRKKTKTKSI